MYTICQNKLSRKISNKYAKLFKLYISYFSYDLIFPFILSFRGLHLLRRVPGVSIGYYPFVDEHLVDVFAMDILQQDQQNNQ